ARRGFLDACAGAGIQGRVKYCYFHFAKNIRDKTNFKTRLKALAFLPPGKVVLNTECPPQSALMWTKFKKAYIVPGRKRHFDPEEWSVNHRTLQGLPRTNNILESWNSSFSKRIPQKPSIFVLISALR
ncbi:hypothetical protein Ciccas_011814, partial [Cichlidogyrus casuarinus]